MFWILFFLIGLVVVLIAILLPIILATLGYSVVLLWTMGLIYVIFYVDDELSKEIKEL